MVSQASRLWSAEILLAREAVIEMLAREYEERFQPAATLPKGGRLVERLRPGPTNIPSRCYSMRWRAF